MLILDSDIRLLLVSWGTGIWQKSRFWHIKTKRLTFHAHKYSCQEITFQKSVSQSVSWNVLGEWHCGILMAHGSSHSIHSVTFPVVLVARVCWFYVEALWRFPWWLSRQDLGLHAFFPLFLFHPFCLPRGSGQTGCVAGGSLLIQYSSNSWCLMMSPF